MTEGRGRWEERLLADLAAAPIPDGASRAAVAERVADILRPSGALARLDEVAVWLAGWQRTATPAVQRPAAVIFAGDHGVAQLSAYPAEVTGAMVEAFEKNQASISAMAAVAGASVAVVDVGVGEPTGDIRTEPAMDEARCQTSFDRGRQAVHGLVERNVVDLLIVGEMGIGNTTAAAAVVCALLDRPADAIVGRGTGVDDEGLARKIEAVSVAVARYHHAAPFEEVGEATAALEALRHLGGTELAAMAGALVEARCRSVPVLLDGFVVGASALAVHRLHPDASGHLWAGHRSAERGHGAVLDHLGLRPLLDLDLRLGEASGAMAAVPLVRMACALVTEVPTFAEWFGHRSPGGA